MDLRFVYRVDGTLLNPDDGCPIARGNIDESGDHHMLESHSPLSNAPLFASPLIERKQLPGVSEPIRDTRSPTYFAISLEVCDMP